MQYMAQERQTLERLLPGLDGALASTDLADLERPGNPGLTMFRSAGGPGLVVPVEHGGLGADAVEAVRVQRAIGSRSPSLAVATTMHHFSLATLVELSSTSSGLEWMLLQAVAEQRLLVASGFAEGRPGAAILQPTMQATTLDGVLRLSGSKKPCSLSGSMDLLTASVAVPDGDGGERMAVALVPKDSAGLHVRPFWRNVVLSGAESDEVVLDDVEVSPDMLILTDSRPDDPLDDLQTTGFLWFELLVTASYLGAASALVEQVLAHPRVPAAERAALAVETESAMLTLECVARGMRAGVVGEPAFASALVARYSVQDTIGRVTRRAVELLGGLPFITSADAVHLAAATSALSFHPPARGRMSQGLADFFAGGRLLVA